MARDNLELYAPKIIPPLPHLCMPPQGGGNKKKKRVPKEMRPGRAASKCFFMVAGQATPTRPRCSLCRCHQSPACQSMQLSPPHVYWLAGRLLSAPLLLLPRKRTGSGCTLGALAVERGGEERKGQDRPRAAAAAASLRPTRDHCRSMWAALPFSPHPGKLSSASGYAFTWA